MNEFHEEANDAHDKETDTDSLGDLDELSLIRYKTPEILAL